MKTASLPISQEPVGLQNISLGSTGFNHFSSFSIVFHSPKILKLKLPIKNPSKTHQNWAHPVQRLSESFRTPNPGGSSPGVGGHPCRRGAEPWHRINEGIHQKLLVDW
jgi:hypothetical protein